MIFLIFGIGISYNTSKFLSAITLDFLESSILHANELLEYMVFNDALLCFVSCLGSGREHCCVFFSYPFRYTLSGDESMVEKS